MSEALDLPLVWAGVLALAVFLYILLDGFDLGVGILFPFAANEEHRDRMMDSVAPVWDGNETWLVLGGLGLFAAFPSAYAVMMPALYMPVGFMLTALIFRGVAFEFRTHAAGTGQRFWSQAFHWGSLVAAYSQGMVLGTLVQGVEVRDRQFAGDMFDWLTPFSFAVGWALVWGYVLLGASWLIIKTEGALLHWARRVAAVAAVVVLVMMAMICIWVPVLGVPAAARWGLSAWQPDWVRLLPLLPIPLLTAVAFFGLFRALYRQARYAPYAWSVVLFLLGYAGLLVGIWPYLVPYEMTIRQSAAAPATQSFLLAGTLVLLPLILGYTVYIYWTFRGKTGSERHQ